MFRVVGFRFVLKIYNIMFALLLVVCSVVLDCAPFLSVARYVGWLAMLLDFVL